MMQLLQVQRSESKEERKEGMKEGKGYMQRRKVRK